RVVTGVRVEGLVLDSSGRVTSVQTSKPVEEASPREPPGIDTLTRIDPKYIPKDDFLTVPTEHAGHVRIGRQNGRIIGYGTPGHIDHKPSLNRQGTELADEAESANPLSVHFTSNAVVVRGAQAKENQIEIARVKLSALPQQGFL